ncbi:S-methyl-5-thioribose-1-phosphate isomerase [candidate division WOR-3 bacterium JGI_Cruoil_03_51_56]|uniref:Methylthioribose-1-phosphate isomerase n=1 Tax=candidate division WOR-3 bacterium JGI_Cruoil_03_51_56 TaxID=1973747 RepID=A0A235BT70_UNCW3|nr:MAG: S-methyl-5-thioribose-1-phosphate isomerase [candidate division WOR-3 bacterium JGI_Cruoil_03_51_56]
MLLTERGDKPEKDRGGSKLPSFLLRAVIYSNHQLKIIDQRLLPVRVRYIRLHNASETARAIKSLAVRGAPNIGVAAAYGLAVEAFRLHDARLRFRLCRAAKMIGQARPTAVNLKWAVQRIRKVIKESGPDPNGLRANVQNEAQRIESEEIANSRAIARYGARLITKDAGILTICNTGALAAPGLGTALGVVFQSYLEGKRPHVYACETRPLLQGARLTASELVRAGIAATLIVDSAAATVMEKCNIVIVGADRIAANGDTANKVGTRMLAVLAREWHKPFYVVAPTTSFDIGCARGDDIVIEERSDKEVRSLKGIRVAPDAIPVFNPAFDITFARYITGFVTEHGLVVRPFLRNIRRLMHDS